MILFCVHFSSARGSYGHHELNYDRYDRDGTGLINVDEFVAFCAFVDPTIDPATLKQSVISGGARVLDVYSLITLFIGDNVGKDEFVAWLAMYQVPNTHCIHVYISIACVT